MIEAAAIQPRDRFLEVGVGSGYAAAVISRIGRSVYAIDRYGDLADLARDRMARLGYDNVIIGTGEGSSGWPEVAPFDVVLVAAALPRYQSHYAGN